MCERGDFYVLLGMDPARFDAEVMRQTNCTAQRAFPWVFDLERGRFIELRDHIVETFRSIKAATAEGQPLRKLGLQLRQQRGMSVLRLGLSWLQQCASNACYRLQAPQAALVHQGGPAATTTPQRTSGCRMTVSADMCRQ